MNGKSIKLKFFMGVIFILSSILVALYLNSAAFAAGECKVSGYIGTDFEYGYNSGAEIKAGFKVEIVELQNVNALTDETGLFEIKNVPQSLTGYTFKISKAGYLTRTLQNVSVNGNMYISPSYKPIVLYAGDMSLDGPQDNVINLLDIVAIARSFNLSKGNPRYSEFNDLNKDGSVNMMDILIVAKRFNTTSINYAPFNLELFPIGATAVNGRTVELTLNIFAPMVISKDKFSIPGLVITDAYIKNTDEKDVIVLKTSLQTAGTVYSIKIGNNTIQFGGSNTPDPDYIEPESTRMLSAVAISNTSVQVKFNTEIDREKAENISNYSIAGLVVVKAELDVSGKILNLTTSSQTAGTIYKIVASNVTDKTGNSIDPEYNSFQFGGIPVTDPVNPDPVNPDVVSPKLLHVIAMNNTKVRVVFDEGMDKVKAENISNYTIARLTVLNAELDLSGKCVNLTTSSQTVGTIYKITVSNVTDKAGNLIDLDNDEYQFGGLPPDTTRPSLISVQAMNNTNIKVTFSEPMDTQLASATYCYYLGLDLGYAISAVKDTEITNGTVWILTTRPMTARIYKLVISDVTDESGNVIDPDKDEMSFAGIELFDTIGPQVTTAIAVNRSTIKITFNEPLKRETIKNDVFTFALNSGNDTSTSKITVGHPDSILVSDDDKTVTVSFASGYMSGGAVYKLTVDTALQDKAGNPVDTNYNCSLFAGISTENPAPKINSVIALDNQTLKVNFNKKFKLLNNLTQEDFAFSPEFTGLLQNCILSEYNTSITLYFNGSAQTDKFSSGCIYTFTLTDSGKSKITDEFGLQSFSGNEEDAIGLFAGIPSQVTSPKISSVVAVNNNTLDITFDQAVDKLALGTLKTEDFTFSIKPTGEISSIIVALVRLEGTFGNKLRVFLNDTYDPSQAFTPARVYKVTINPEKVINFNGIRMADTDNSALFAAISTQNPPPAIENACKVDASQIKVVFTEKITGVKADGSDFNLIDSRNGSKISIKSALIDSNDTSEKTVILVLSDTNIPSGIITVSVAQGTSIKDEAGVGFADATSKFDFVY